jgi:hypothetical protein
MELLQSQWWLVRTGSKRIAEVGLDPMDSRTDQVMDSVL